MFALVTEFQGPGLHDYGSHVRLRSPRSTGVPDHPGGNYGLTVVSSAVPPIAIYDAYISLATLVIYGYGQRLSDFLMRSRSTLSPGFFCAVNTRPGFCSTSLNFGFCAAISTNLPVYLPNAPGQRGRHRGRAWPQSVALWAGTSGIARLPPGTFMSLCNIVTIQARTADLGTEDC